MKAMANIHAHVRRIHSQDLYIEQTIYQNINKVVSEAHQGFRFAEQAVMFDFNPTTFQVALNVDEANRSTSRFGAVAVPKWFGVDLRPCDFVGTPYMNNLLGLFHFNQGDCQVLPVTALVDYRRCVMDVDRNLLFLKIACSSVEEARRRALVLAYLTYDMTRHIFVKLNSGQMLENPFDHQNIYEVQELYNLQSFEEAVNVDALLARQGLQQHQGMILTDKDAKTLQQHNQFRSVELNEKFLNVSVPAVGQQQPDSALQTMVQSPGGPLQSTTPLSNNDAPASLYETRKMNEQTQNGIKEQRFVATQKEAQQFRAEKTALME